MLYIIIAILIIIILLIFLNMFKSNKMGLIEGINTDISMRGSKIGSDKRKFYRGEFNSMFNGRLSIDDQYFSDKLLSGTIYYPNRYEGGQTMGSLLYRGIDKCHAECPGTCVEYMVSGNAWCFTPFTDSNIYQ